MKIRTFGYCLIAVAILLLFASVNSHAATPLPIGKTQIGGTVKLAPGSYDFYVNNITGPYTVEGGPGVVVNSMTVNNSSGLTFKNISFSTLSTIPTDNPKTVYPFRITDGSSNRIIDSNFSGPSSGNLSNLVSFLTITGCTNCSIVNNTFSYGHDAVDHERNPNLLVSGNTCNYILDDCIRGDLTTATYLNNSCYNQHFDLTDTDHPDCIQLWPINLQNGQPAVEGGTIYVSGTRLVKGVGATVHGVFLKTAFPGYYDLSAPASVTIINSNFDGPGDDAIYVEAPGTKGLVSITGNHIQARSCSDVTMSKAGIRLLPGLSNVTLTGNSAATYTINGVLQKIVPVGNTVQPCG